MIVDFSETNIAKILVKFVPCWNGYHSEVCNPSSNLGGAWLSLAQSNILEFWLTPEIHNCYFISWNIIGIYK